MKNLKENKTKPFPLWWFDKEEERHFPAGVAFYSEDYGEYQLRIDMHPDNQYYLKATSSVGNETHYRVEVALKRNGEFKRRKPVGDGHSNELTSGDIVINLAPYKRTLILGGQYND